MRVEHIVWRTPLHEGKERGLLKIEYGFHGDSSHYQIIVEGQYCHATNKITMAYRPFDLGWSWCQLKEIGDII